MKKKEKNIPYGIPQVAPELDFTTTSLEKWCQRYGAEASRTTSGDTTTYNYNAKPENLGKAFKIKVPIKYEVVITDLDEGQTEGLYMTYRIVHFDSVGKAWWVEEEAEEQVFETTLHSHS